MDYRSLDSAVSASRSLEIHAILVAFSIVSATAVALRTYIRSRVLHSFGWDDGFMVTAQVFTLGAAVAIGLGRLLIYTTRQDDQLLTPV